MVTRFQRKTTAALAALMLMMVFTGSPAAAPKKNASTPFNVLPMLITSVTVANGQLVANGLAGTTPFQAPILLSPRPAAAGECPVLDLSLGPIHLTLLGLNVDTSSICLEVTATPGGGLLGNLLCSIGTLLNGGTSLATVLGGLTSTQLNTLNTGLTQVLNQAVFIPLTRSDALAGAACNILNLDLGPLDLNLLGLNVRLNNCSNPPGPVTVDITATPAGGLLGNLLCSLSNVLGHGAPAAIAALLGNIARLIGALLG